MSQLKTFRFFFCLLTLSLLIGCAESPTNNTTSKLNWGTVNGKVTDAANNPVNACRVFCISSDTQAVLTLPDGTFLIDNINFKLLVNEAVIRFVVSLGRRSVPFFWFFCLQSLPTVSRLK